MEVGGQLHAPAALPPGKEPLVPIGEKVGWTPEAESNAYKISVGGPGGVGGTWETWTCLGGS
jgi:hypothetical protein